MGASSIFLQVDARLENAITAVQSLADGGSRPDSSTEDAIRIDLADLADIETRIKSLYGSLLVDDAEGIKLNSTRAIRGLKREGREIIARIANRFSYSPLYDYFSSKSTQNSQIDFFRTI